MIHIAIDGREANINNRVGSNVYAFEIIKQLEQLLEKRDDIRVTVLLASSKIIDLPEARKNWKYTSFGPQKFWTQWALPLHLFKNQKKYDVLFTPGHYAPRISKVPYVSSVMDTAYLKYPEQFKKADTLKLTKWTRYSVKNAKKIIAISEHTKDEVLTHYDREAQDVVVAYPAANVKRIRVDKGEKEKLFKQYKISQPYILFVGTMQPRKNIVRLIEAFEILDRMSAGRSLKKKKSSKAKKIKKTKLVLAGKVGWLSEEISNKIANSPLKKRIITTGFITEKDKQILYKNANVSTLIGLYEGFGIPPLESLMFGTVPVVSGTTSLPEVVGEAGILANPLDPSDIADKLWQALNMNTRQKGLFRKAARIQLKQFSWKKSSELILETLLNVVDEEKNKPE